MPDPIVQYQSAPFAGSFSIFSAMLNAVPPAAAPYEGVWMPTRFAKGGSFELTTTGTGLTMEADIWATNQAEPTNTYVVTVGGTITANDIASLTFNGQNLPSAGTPAAYTVQGGDTTALVAAGLAAAINASTALGLIGVTAKAVGSVVTITWPSALPQQGAAGGPSQPGSPAIANTIVLSKAVSGSATETLTIALGTDGTNVLQLTAAGLVAAPVALFPVRWIKARLPTLSGSGGPTATLNFNGVG